MAKIRKNREIYFIPNFLSSMNILFGFLSFHATLQEKYKWAAYWIIIAAILDAFDGIIARLTKTESEFGAQLDSLADAISFGTAPCFLLYFWGFKSTISSNIGIFFSFIFLIAGVLRLARYNTLQKDKPDRKYYLGLTVPSASLLIATLVLLQPQPLQEKLFAFLLVSLVLILSICMVSTIRYRNFLYFDFQHGIDLKTALLAIIIISSIIVFPKKILLIFFSLNVISGPATHVFNLSRKKVFKSVKEKESNY